MTVTQVRRFLVLKSFDWEGKSYRKGEHLETQDEHPRIGGMVRHRFMRYDPLDGETTNYEPGDAPVDQPEPQKASQEPPQETEAAKPVAAGVEFQPTG